MIIRTATLALLLITTGSSIPGWSSLSEALHLAAEEGKPVVVYVSAPWCGPCLRLERETFMNKYVQERLSRVARAGLRIDGHDRIQRIAGYRLSEAEWAVQLGIESTPALVFLSPDGTVLGIHQGFIDVDSLVDVLDILLK